MNKKNLILYTTNSCCSINAEADAKEFSAFEKTLQLIKLEIIPIVKMELGL